MESQEITDLSVEQAKETLSKFRSLARSPEWDLLVKVGQNQIARLRRTAQCQPALTREDAAQRDWDLAAASGMEIFLGLPDTMINALETQIQMESMKNEHTEHATNATNPPERAP